MQCRCMIDEKIIMSRLDKKENEIPVGQKVSSAEKGDLFPESQKPASHTHSITTEPMKNVYSVICGDCPSNGSGCYL